jgi:hypothetical protein
VTLGRAMAAKARGLPGCSLRRCEYGVGARQGEARRDGVVEWRVGRRLCMKMVGEGRAFLEKLGRGPILENTVVVGIDE